MNDQEWFAEHTAYLATPEWAFRRGQVLNRDGYRCQARLPGCRGDAVHVHHLTYKHWRNEPLFDLTSVCVACHHEITEMDRGNRPAEARLASSSVIRVDIPGSESLLERARRAVAAERGVPIEHVVPIEWDDKVGMDIP